MLLCVPITIIVARLVVPDVDEDEDDDGGTDKVESADANGADSCFRRLIRFIGVREEIGDDEEDWGNIILWMISTAKPMR